MWSPEVDVGCGVFLDCRLYSPRHGFTLNLELTDSARLSGHQPDLRRCLSLYRSSVGVTLG